MSPLKILLICCEHNTKEINEPLGIECLASSLRNEFGNDVSIELAFDSLPKGPFDHVHISCNYNVSDMKKIYNFYLGDAELITIGGSYALLHPEEILEKCPEAICVIGEGEISTVQITKAAIEHLHLEQVPNLVFLKDGKIIKTKREILDLSNVNYIIRHELLKPIIEKNGLVRMETSRGCDWNRCAFCVMPEKYNSKRKRCYPTIRVVEEIARLSKDGVRTICFTDEEFIGRDPQSTIELVEMIADYKVAGTISEDMKFMASVGVRFIKGKSNEDFDKMKILLRKMKNVGFDGVFIGIESGSKTQLERYRKGVTVEENEDVLNCLREIGINADIGFIMFDHLMTFSELEENVHFIEKNSVLFASSRVIKLMRIVAGTAYQKQVSERHGLPSEFKFREYDLDLYVDEDIRKVLSLLPLDSLSKGESYEIQSNIRKGIGSIADENTLSKNRDYELQLLKSAIEKVKLGSNHNSESTIELES